MDQLPYASFWKEQPEKLKNAWRPTDASRGRLIKFWMLQGFLLVCIIFMGLKLAKESQRLPQIYAKLPNGLMFQTRPVAYEMDKIARVGLVNDTLLLLYYQEGAHNYLNTLTQVKPQILAVLSHEMQGSAKQTDTTVQLNIAESFETVYNAKVGFKVLTKGMLVRREGKKASEAPLYVQTVWLKTGQTFMLSEINEIKPGDYYEGFVREKERLQKLSKEDLERELEVNPDVELQIKARGTSLF